MPDNLLQLREGAEPTTTFVHPASGLATAFRRLVPHLGGRASVFAFENVEPGSPQHATIPAIAEDYWGQLRVGIRGPLVLAGWSFGGPVALRIAALAEAAGHQVRHVVLIDSGTPELLATRTETLVVRMAGLFELDPATVEAAEHVTDREQALELVASRLRAVHGNPGIEAADLRPFADVYDWHLRAARQPWRPRTVAAPVLLVRARDEAGWHDAPADLGWSAVLGAAPATAWTPGTHYDLMSATNAPHLADVLTPLLTVSGEPCGSSEQGSSGQRSEHWSDSRD